MPRAIYNAIAKAGVPQKITKNFRGRGGSRSKITIEFNFPLKSFLKEVLETEERWLLYYGLTALRQYRRMVGRPYPKQLTKKLGITKRYKEEIEQGARHPYPYKRIGTLRSHSNFDVNLEEGNVIAGPMLLPKKKGGPVTPKTVPQLLNEGGRATVAAPRYRKVTITDKRKGRGRRKTKKYFYQRVGTETKTVQYRSFNWTKDLHEFALEKLIQRIARDKIGG